MCTSPPDGACWARAVAIDDVLGVVTRARHQYASASSLTLDVALLTTEQVVFVVIGVLGVSTDVLDIVGHHSWRFRMVLDHGLRRKGHICIRWDTHI